MQHGNRSFTMSSTNDAVYPSPRPRSPTITRPGLYTSSSSRDSNGPYQPSYTPTIASGSASIPVSGASPLDQLVRRTSSRRMRTVAAARDREAHAQMNMNHHQIQEEHNEHDHPTAYGEPVGDAAGHSQYHDQQQSSSSSSYQQPSASSSYLVPSVPADGRAYAYSEHTEDDEYEYNYDDYYGSADADADDHHYNPVLDGYPQQHAPGGGVNSDKSSVSVRDSYAYSPMPLPGERPVSASGPQLSQYKYSHRGRASQFRVHNPDPPSIYDDSAPDRSTNPTITISPTPSHNTPASMNSQTAASSPNAAPSPPSELPPARVPRLGIPPPINTTDLSSNSSVINNSPLPSPLLHSTFAFRRDHVDSVFSSTEHDTDADYTRDYSQDEGHHAGDMMMPSSGSGQAAYALGAFGLSMGLGAGLRPYSPGGSTGAGREHGDGGGGALTDRSSAYSSQTGPALRDSWNSGGAVSGAGPSNGAYTTRHVDALAHETANLTLGNERMAAVSSVRTAAETLVEREAGGLVVKAAQGGMARPVAEEPAFFHGEHMGERVTVQLPDDMKEGKMKVLERLAQQQQQQQQQQQHQQNGMLTPQMATSGTGAGLRPEHAVGNRQQAEVYSQYSYYSYQSPVPSPQAENFGKDAPAGTPSPRRVSFAPSAKPQAPPAAITSPEDYLQQGINHHEANRLQESARCFERSAIEGGGCGVGMLMYGLTLRHGWGCRKNEFMGFKWLMKAAEHAVGDLERVRTAGGEAEIVGGVQTELVLAIYEVGQCFFHGWGVPKDAKMGVSYYKVAARLGDSDAQNDLAFCLANGKGCKKDKKGAAKWYRAAVAQGLSDVGLAWIYKEKYQ